VADEAQPTEQTSCSSSPAISVAEARAIIRNRLKSVGETEDVVLDQALGRVLAADIASPVQMPRFDNSAMDGYAVRGADLTDVNSLVRLRLVAHSKAGAPWLGVLNAGEAVQIATGAAIPEGADTVVVLEHATTDGQTVSLKTNTQKGANIRRAGEEFQRGDCAMPAGTWLGPAEIGSLANLGVSTVRVKRRLTVAVCSTGDELVSLADSDGAELRSGEIYDSNRYMIRAALERFGVEVIDAGLIPDNLEDTRAAFTRLSEVSDLVVSSGGASGSDTDFVGRVVEELGELLFWRVEMKPGRPLLCGKIGESVLFGLPGNPVAAMVGVYQFVLPALRLLMGCSSIETPTFKVRSVAAICKPAGRTDFRRGVLRTGSDGQLEVESMGSQSSARLSSITAANCFVVLGPSTETVDAGEWVDVQAFHGLV